MKYTLSLLLATALLLSGLTVQSQEKKTRYTDYDNGYRLWYYDQWDSAFLMFNRYVNNPDDTLKKGSAYKFMGEMQWYVGDLYGAQESLIGAIHTLDQRNKKHHEELSYVYNILGNVSLDLKSYGDAISYYNKAIYFARGTGFIYDLLNGKATALQKSGNYKGAIVIYDSILVMQPSDQSLVARIIDNRANSRWLQNRGYPVLPEFWTALKIRVDSQYHQGLNASYAHLADYYAKSNPDSALWYANKMFEKAKSIHSAKDILEAIDKLVSFTRNPVLKEYWYQEFKLLNDSLQRSKDTTRNRFAFIRYEVQKNKADNLALQQHITRQRLLTYSVILLAVSIIIGLVAWYRKRRKRIKQEAELSIRDARLNTSRKIHDVVANGLYGIMNELEHSEEIERDPLLTKVEDLYEKSRDISYEELAYTDDTDYDKQIHGLLNEFTNEQTKVFAVGNQPVFWNRVTSVQKNQLLLILREIMTNMKKHSGAGNVVIKFKEDNNTGTINYSDDGKGFPADIEYGNGLHNTVNRIQSLNGDIIFGKSDKAGASISIRFPLQSSKA
ncbi:MAG: tetratricopeptide repeat-containing sensor histidine kinase [Bacteroidota bacterium]